MSFSTQDIRNIALLGHQSCGKTTLGQAILFATGSLTRLERVDEGNSCLDFDPDEIDKKMSVLTMPGWGAWRKTKINFLDTPGFDDFVGEQLSALSVVEGAVLVARADGGVESGTEKTWETLGERSMPRLVFINRMDKEHANYASALAALQEALQGCTLVPFQLPMGDGAEFKGIVDLLRMKAYAFDDKGAPVETEIPGDLQGQVEEARASMVEGAAEASEELMEKYFEAGTLTDEEVISGLSRGVREGTLAPVFLGDSYSARGVHLLLDAVVDLMPSPDQRLVEIDGEPVPADPDGPPLAYIYKHVNEQSLGDIYLIRAFSGTLSSGKDVVNLNKSSNERIGQLSSLMGKNREDMSELVAGDLAATVKLKDCSIGDTLGVKGGNPLPVIEFPRPMNEVAISAGDKADEEKLGTGMNRLNSEDPSFNLRFDNEVRQAILAVQGDTHMDVLLSRLRRKFKVEVQTEKPRIPYRETISKTVESHYRHKKQTGGRGQFGEVYVRLEPTGRGEGFEFLNEITGGVIPGKFIPAVEKGIREAMEDGAVSGYRVVDLRAALYFGSFHNVDSDEHSFKFAGSQALKQGIREAGAKLLEPICNLEIKVPDENLGDIMGDISGRRGRIGGTEQKGRYQIVKASAPLAELYKYGTQLRSITGGRGSYAMEFSHYEEVPHDQAEKIIAEAQAQKAE